MARFKPGSAALVAAVFIGLGAVLTAIGHFAVRAHMAQLRGRTQGLFAALIPLEQARLRSWRAEREADIVYYARGREALAHFRPVILDPGDAAARREAEGWFRGLQAAHPEYAGISVVNRRGRAVLRLPAGMPVPDDARRVRALNDDGVVWGALGLAGGQAFWDLALGIDDGVVLVRVDPGREGLPSLKSDLMTHDGGIDVVVARPERAGALVLDHDPSGAAATRLYEQPPGSLTARALLETPGAIVEGEDHLGRTVFAAAAPLTGSDWRLVFLREAGSSLRDTRALVAACAAAGGVSVAGAFLLVAWLYRRQEDAAARVSSRLDALLLQAPDPVILFDPDGLVLDANEAALRTYGYSLAEFRSLPADRLRSAADAEAGNKRIAKVLAEETAEFRAEHVRKDGRAFPVEVHSRRFDTPAGPVVQAFVRDTSAWVAAERRLTRLARFHAALTNCQRAVSRAESRAPLAEELCRILVEDGGFPLSVVWWEAEEGRSLRALGAHGRTEILPPDRVVPVKDGVVAAGVYRDGTPALVADIGTDPRAGRHGPATAAAGIKSLAVHPIVVAGRTRGALAVFAASAEALDAEASELIAVLALDIGRAVETLAATAQASEATVALAENQRLLKHISEALPIGIFIMDVPERRWVYVSPSLERLMGHTPAAVYSGGAAFLAEVVHPEDAASFAAFLGRCRTAADGEAVDAELRARDASGRWRWLHTTGVVFERGTDGAPRLVLGSVEDIGGRMEAERQFRELAADHRRVAQAVEHAAESIVITDEKGVIQYINPACARITGYTREEAVGRHTRALKSGVHPPEFYKALWKTIASGLVWTGHLVNRRKDGSLFEEDASISPVKDERGRITNFVAVKKDVTKERSLESQLQQSQKLEAVGRLAGGVAHDFNNILTAILGYSQMARLGLPEGSPLKDDLDEIEKGARRAADLTRQLLIFSRKQVIRPQLIDPVQVVGGLQKMLRRIVGEDVHLKFVSETAGARVLADPGQFEQVVMNFVVNSRDAMPKGGEAEVAVRQARVTEPVRGADGLVPPGDYCILTVRDAGHGIPPEVLPRIFEPFFTTKAPGEGTGLGLSTVYGIVKQAGAYLAVDSTPGLGTVMSVYWPVSAPAEDDAAAAAPPPPAGGTESVLLVEDEAPVLELSRRLLTKAGYAVTAFQSPREALDWARTGRFDLLFTDVVLPGAFDGKALAEALCAARPGLPVLFTTGYSEDAVSQRGVMASGTRLLPKPYTEEGLLRAVRDALG